MKITPNTPTNGPELEPLHGQGGRRAAGAGAANGSGEDTATLGSGQATVTQLQAQLNAAPEVRSTRVAQLQSALANGTYTINPGQVAQAMIADLSGRQD